MILEHRSQRAGLPHPYVLDGLQAGQLHAGGSGAPYHPAVSQHIRQLEAHYGCALFHKGGRRGELTQAGAMLFRALETMENDETRLKAQAKALTLEQPAKAPLRFGCTRTICDYWIPRVLARHMAKHPDEMVQMSVGNTQELVEGLEAGTIDFALVEGSFNRALFDSAPVSRERYVAVGSADEFDASYKPVSMASLLDRRLILREAGSGTREILEKHLAARDLDLDDFAGTFEVASIPAIKLCVRAGTGITFLYRAAVERELDQGELRDITPSDFFVEHDFRLIWQRGSLAALPGNRPLLEAIKPAVPAHVHRQKPGSAPKTASDGA